jgi:hypothetical protein
LTLCAVLFGKGRNARSQRLKLHIDSGPQPPADHMSALGPLERVFQIIQAYALYE